MALSNNLTKDPLKIINPDYRWVPGDKELAKSSKESLMPPLVQKLRKEVYQWRSEGYEGASETSKALLKHWFKSELYSQSGENFNYYFAQREAVETVIFLYEVKKVHSPEDMIKFASYEISIQQFDEDWPRYVVKMATGTGKTKVLSLLIAWSYFHKLYEQDSVLTKNFLLITPNIIVLERLKTDFDGAKIFLMDPVIPQDGYEDKNWKSDFQMEVHIQDDARVNRVKGNLFLTNIHRVYRGEDKEPSFEDEDRKDYFLGKKAVSSIKEGDADVGKIVRELDELMILNDEAHHVKAEGWWGTISDVHRGLVQKGSRLSLQIDVTATPKEEKGQIFPQTITDYPLVEAIHQNLVKHPVLPDGPSQAKMRKKGSSDFIEMYSDFINLGVKEWKEQTALLKKFEKKPILFIMVDDTKNCDKVGEYLERTYSELSGSVLVIHTNKKGEIAEASTGSKKKKEELEELRRAANNLDHPDSKYKAVVSVLMLKEGWDIRNVTTIVGLREYASNILPEQTIGRGLRKMGIAEEETLSVVGTPKFISFVENIRDQGVELEKKTMGSADENYDPLVIEIEKGNPKKNINRLDIEMPVLYPKICREFTKLDQFDEKALLKEEDRFKIKDFSEEERREIVFEYALEDEKGERKEHHATILDEGGDIDATSMIRWFVDILKRKMRLVAKEDVIYAKMKSFIKSGLFEKEVDLNDGNVVRNLSEPDVKNSIFRLFEKAINDSTVIEKGGSGIKEWKKISETKPYLVKNQEFVTSDKTPFNKIVGDSHLELEFSDYLNSCQDVVSFAKNYQYAKNRFHLDYQNQEGGISYYVPDFLVKCEDKEIYVVETKGNEDLDDPRKYERLKKWCRDANKAQNRYAYQPLLVKEKTFHGYRNDLNSFEALIRLIESNR